MGKRLQELRQRANMSQSKLAAAVGIPVGSLKNWEQGLRLPRLDAAWKLARALGVTLDELAGKVFEEAPSGEKKPAKGKTRKAKGE